ncbi:unnamed protein product [Brachionus calyciflorus]|uniref:LIM zinc-binding domain-containing protein n=1 Tax=Brachionus calyciflorus TaxID=104777 RepID=A0A813U4G7_9BILA|nr:unnamed protein product [Brachionus calyciflorus]
MKSPPSYSNEPTRTVIESNNKTPNKSLNFKQYFENLKNSKKKRDNPSVDETVLNSTSSSSLASSSQYSLQSQPNIDDNNLSTQKHKLIKFSTSNSKLKFTHEIEKELSNLTLSIDKELKNNYQEENDQEEYYGNCQKCAQPVLQRENACLAMNEIYHTDCFVCVSCGRQLRGKSFYYLNNQVYCEEDYLYSGFLENAEKCDVCGHIIVDMILQAMGKAYHPGCFRCFSCNECLDGVPFTLDIHNRIYCIRDYYRIYAPKCSACGLAITPIQGTNETVRVVSMEKDFHLECYVCEDCGVQLTDEQEKRCYPIGRSLLCYTCHLKRIELTQLDSVLISNLVLNRSGLASNSNNYSANNSFQLSNKKF